MKTLAFTLILIAVLGLLTYTNPSQDDYRQFVRQTMMRELRRQQEPPAGRWLGSLLGQFGGSVVAAQTIRRDFVFFSLYDAEFGDQRVRFVGMFRNFIGLSDQPSPAD